MSHVDELFLMFRFSQVSGSWLGDLALQTEEDIAVSRKLVQLWTNFAKTGRPTEGWITPQEHEINIVSMFDIFRPKLEVGPGIR